MISLSLYKSRSLEDFSYLCMGDGFDQFPFLTPLYLVCRQLYRETISLLYSEPIFDFQDGIVMERWSELLGDAKRAAVTSVVLWDNWHGRGSEILACFPGLKFLYSVAPMDFSEYEEEFARLDVKVRWLDHTFGGFEDWVVTMDSV